MQLISLLKGYYHKSQFWRTTLCACLLPMWVYDHLSSSSWETVSWFGYVACGLFKERSSIPRLSSYNKDKFTFNCNMLLNFFALVAQLIVDPVFQIRFPVITMKTLTSLIEMDSNMRSIINGLSWSASSVHPDEKL